MPLYYGRGQLPGTATNDSASAGNVGEVIVSTGSSVAISSGTTANITSISLTPGDWDISAFGGVSAGGATMYTTMFISHGTTSATLDVTVGKLSSFSTAGIVPGNGNGFSATLPTYRISVSTNTTYYLTINSSFSVSTSTALGYIKARRAR